MFEYVRALLGIEPKPAPLPERQVENGYKHSIWHNPNTGKYVVYGLLSGPLECDTLGEARRVARSV